MTLTTTTRSSRSCVLLPTALAMLILACGHDPHGRNDPDTDGGAGADTDAGTGADTDAGTVPDTDAGCSAGCGVMCVDECTPGERRCAGTGGQGAQTCGNHDADACSEWGAVIACAPDEVCGAEGRCVPSCVGPACSCTPSCAAAVCGGSDGCGGSCAVGTCGPDQTCQQGSCVCAAQTCGGACCGAGELCQANACVPGPTAVWRSQTAITNRNLTGIWGSSASNIWVVGAGGTMLHFNGTVWSSVLSGTTLDLADIWGSGPNDVWAVGGEWNSPGVILHYNGSQWSQVATPERSANAVWGTSATNVFVAGGTSTDGSVQRFNGSTWTLIGGQSTSRYVGVSGTSGSDVWVVDLFSAQHYNGTSWSTTPLATMLISAVWLGGPSDGWAVGTEFALHRFNGTTWQQVASPLSGSNDVARAVWGRSTNDVWVVGWAVGHRAIIHFDGAGWQLSGPPINSALFDVWGTSATNVWAVGTNGTILHYSP